MRGWKKESAYSLVRECGHWNVSKGMVNGTPAYLLWRGEKLVGGPFASADLATDHCEQLIAEEASEEESSPAGDRQSE